MSPRQLEYFLEKWYKFSKKNLLLVLLSIVLFKEKIVHYSIFTGICVPNVFIISTMILLGKDKNIDAYAPAKYEALKKYASKYNVKWAFVRDMNEELYYLNDGEWVDEMLSD